MMKDMRELQMSARDENTIESSHHAAKRIKNKKLRSKAPDVKSENLDSTGRKGMLKDEKADFSASGPNIYDTTEELLTNKNIPDPV